MIHLRVYSTQSSVLSEAEYLCVRLHDCVSLRGIPAGLPERHLHRGAAKTGANDADGWREGEPCSGDFAKATKRSLPKTAGRWTKKEARERKRERERRRWRSTKGRRVNLSEFSRRLSTVCPCDANPTICSAVSESRGGKCVPACYVTCLHG